MTPAPRIGHGMRAVMMPETAAPEHSLVRPALVPALAKQVLNLRITGIIAILAIKLDTPFFANMHSPLRCTSSVIVSACVAARWKI